MFQHVNLIAKRRALQSTARRVVRMGAVGVVVGVLLVSASTTLMLADMRFLDTRAAQLQEETDQLRPLLVRYQRARAQQERFQDHGRFYLQARKSQDWWLAWLYQIQAGLPADAWLFTVDTQGQGEKRVVLIDGGAQTEESVSRFVTALGTAPSAVLGGEPPRLVFMRLVTTKDGEYFQFQVSVPARTGEAPRGKP